MRVKLKIVREEKELSVLVSSICTSLELFILKISFFFLNPNS
ncbi:hypothetical protein LEP1GSC188_3216 [Leptospira weilii serovar Topaz str. LT2116]|uniref:Uncharacterized protein n=1 Tax=Leptospira weilii serovar Topaz str. LT2116 TaxID=1088540 RepID=M3GEP9_9LEPT|nr:hypothetical protein LEP1GSC188_3216 [Leptospira weilii serovar Topaz str. LT2116]